MSITIRVAEKQDCPALLELIHELAVYEKLPEEVTVTLEEFADAGIGERPVLKTRIRSLVLPFIIHAILPGKVAVFTLKTLLLPKNIVEKGLENSFLKL